MWEGKGAPMQMPYGLFFFSSLHSLSGQGQGVCGSPAQAGRQVCEEKAYHQALQAQQKAQAETEERREGMHAKAVLHGGSVLPSQKHKVQKVQRVREKVESLFPVPSLRKKQAAACHAF